MKKLFLPFVAALALTGCTNDDIPEPNGSEDSNGGHFLAVNIVSQGGSGSRADGGESNANGGSSSSYDDYEDGVGLENTVTAVRLYFFTSTGDALSIKKSSDTNYYDIPTDQIGVNDPSEDHVHTVEKILKAVVIVEPGESLPAKVVAVINPILGDEKTVPNSLGSKSLSLSELQSRCVNYSSYANKGHFIMSNSVYADVNGLVDATVISAANYAKTPEDAKVNPVEIYVERTVAKVRLSVTGLPSIDSPTGEKLYKLYRVVKKDDSGNITESEELTVAKKTSNAPSTGNDQTPSTTDEQTPSTGGTQTADNGGYKQTNVYLKLDGWDVTADLSLAWFFKKIKVDWRQNYLGSDIEWNDPNKHRSYWADICIPEVGTNENNYYAYNDANHFKSKAFDGKEAVYCNENAERTATSKFVTTKVLIKGTLCDVNGNPFTIAEYGGNRFVDTDDYATLRSRYIEMMKGMKAELPWRKVTEGGEVKYVQLTADDITMKAVEYINPSDIDGSNSPKAAAEKTYKVDPGRYYVYPCLNETAAEYDWLVSIRYADDGETIVEGAKKTADDINKDLLKLSHAKVWNGGKTYYYAEIQHLGNKSGGVWGTVRNHIYDINLTKIYGIGTPVYGEELVIIPEKPKDDETYIAARVNILRWRVVSNNTILEWD